MFCFLCKKETKNAKFCSRSCAARLNGTAFPKRKTTRLCTNCNKTVRNYKSTLCEEHFLQYQNRFKQDYTIGDYRNKLSVKGKHPSWLSAHIRAFARSWFKHLLKEGCRHCGYDKHVELAHIIPVSSFEDDTPLNKINCESNIIPLCPNCHWEFDNLKRTIISDLTIIRNTYDSTNN